MCGIICCCMSIVKIIFNLFFYEDIHPCHLLLNICELETASDNKGKKSYVRLQLFGSRIQPLDDSAETLQLFQQGERIAALKEHRNVGALRWLINVLMFCS